MSVHALRWSCVAAGIASCSSACPVTAAELHVPGDYPTIQMAIDAAAGGDEIVVAPGVYNETIDFVAKSDITLRSAQGPAETILDGRCLGRTMLRVEQGSTGVTIEGFTLRNADPEGGTLVGGTIFCCGNNGGAMLVRGESDTVIEACVFRDNVLDVPESAWSSNGAALAVLEGSSVTIIDSEFVDNLLPAVQANVVGGAAIRVDQQSTLTVTGTRFHGNQAPDHAKGGAIYLRDSTVEVVECTFTENVADWSGGAIHATNSDLVVANCVFRVNSAIDTSCGGAAIAASDVVAITGCVFTDNVAGPDGAAVCGIGLIQDSAFCNNQPAHIGAGWQDGGGNTFDEGNCGKPPPPPVLTYGYEYGNWNFNLLPPGATVPLGASLAADFGIGELDLSGWGGTAQAIGGTELNGMWCELAGEGLGLVSSNGDGNGTGLDFHFDMSGLRNLAVSYAVWRGTNAPTLHTWLWSLDGETFSQADEFTIEPPTTWHVREIDFSGIDELDDARSVTLRLVLAGGPDAVTATTTYFDNIQVHGEPLPPLGDLDEDGEVGTADLLILLGAWGACPPSGDCSADVNGDGVVGTADLLVLLFSWG